MRPSNLQRAVDRLEKLESRAIEESAYAWLLRECGRLGALEEGRRVHQHIRSHFLVDQQADRYLSNLLVEMYGKCGSLDEAQRVFGSMQQQRNAFSWTLMMSASVRCQQFKLAGRVFSEMELEGVKPMAATFTSLLAACDCLAWGRRLHERVVNSVARPDLILATSIITMYARSGSIVEARSVFDRLECRDPGAWNAMVAAYAQSGHYSEALELYRSMICSGTRPTALSFLAVLGACQQCEHCSAVHLDIVKFGYEKELDVVNSLVNAYAKCGEFDQATNVFEALACRSVFSWTSMVAAYAQRGHGKESLRIFRMMEQEGVVPNEVTYVAALEACAVLPCLQTGKSLHERAVWTGYDRYIEVSTSLVNMYGKCGDLVSAKAVFRGMQGSRNFYAWACMAAAYAVNGQPLLALSVYDDMCLFGVSFTATAFLTLLSLCSHAGLLREGIDRFTSMVRDHGIDPQLDHFDCMVDLLARTGRLREAEELIEYMPLWPGSVGWNTLCGSSQVQGNGGGMYI